MLDLFLLQQDTIFMHPLHAILNINQNQRRNVREMINNMQMNYPYCQKPKGGTTTLL